jgi:hypothetical protein
VIVGLVSRHHRTRTSQVDERLAPTIRFGMASHLPAGNNISHSHPASGAIPPVPAAKNGSLTSLAWWLLCNVQQLAGRILSEDFNEAERVTTGEILMVAFNPNYRIPPAGYSAVPSNNRVDERVRRFFDQHPEVSRQEFLLEAVWREIRFREQRETTNGAGNVRRENQGARRPSVARPPLSAEDIRIHARLNERLALNNYERYGLWPKLRRFLFSNRLVRWLGTGFRGQKSEVRSPKTEVRSQKSKVRGQRSKIRS